MQSLMQFESPQFRREKAIPDNPKFANDLNGVICSSLMIDYIGPYSYDTFSQIDRTLNHQVCARIEITHISNLTIDICRRRYYPP